MCDYVKEFGFAEYEQSQGKDENYHDIDYEDIDLSDCEEDEEEDFDPRSGNMMDDLGLSWRDFY